MKRVLTTAFLEAGIWLEFIIGFIPGNSGILIRRLYWRLRLHECGTSFSLLTNAIITNPEAISLGDNVTIMQDVKLLSHADGCIRIGNNVSMNTNIQIGAAEKGRIQIGNNVIIGPNCVLRASNHAFSLLNMPIRQQGHQGGTIIIEDDVWIGSNCVILPDITIGRGAIVGAGAVVTKNVESYTINGGVPARVIGDRRYSESGRPDVAPRPSASKDNP